MSRWETRTNHTDRNHATPRAEAPAYGRLGAMLERAGRLAGERWRGEPQRSMFEQLENRVLLYGDHPGFDEVFNRPDPLPVMQIVLDQGGAGSAIGTINPAMDNDVLRFVAPGNDFVRIWADTIANNSTLDSSVEVFRREGPNHTPALIVSGTHNNGGDGANLTGGNFRDGWAGFVAEEGVEYFIVVRSDRPSGAGSIGEYTLRVNARSVFAELDEITGRNTLEGDITRRGGDRVYRIRSGEAEKFNSLITVTVDADHTDFDPRVEIYGANGLWITGDSDSGNIIDSFAVLRGQQRQEDASDVFYVRVRSDSFGDPITQPSTGLYNLHINGVAAPIVVDPVTRRGQRAGGISDQNDSALMRFQAQGTGLTFITNNVGIPGGLPDSALRLYQIQPYGETDGDLKRRAPLAGFNELPGAFSRLITPLVGGNHYFIVVENFDGNGGGAFITEIEAHHTFSQIQPLDDHITTPGLPGEFDPADPAVRRQFEMATPIVWGDPVLAPMPRNPATGQGFPGPLLPIEDDHSMVQLGRATGRIYGGNDRDLFQFVPPIDMLGEFEGMVWPQDSIHWPPPPEPGEPEPAHPFFGADPEINVWYPYFRPATRLQIMTQGLTMFNSRIRVFDSNFDVVYDFNNNVLTGPYAADPSGMLDPASWPPELVPPWFNYTFAGDQPAGIEVWGGEVYYLEVSSQSGHGRYEVELQVDAYEDKEDVSRFYPGYAAPGEWASAYELWIGETTGDTTNFTNIASAGAPVPVPFTPWWRPPGRASVGGLSNTGNAPMLGRAFAMNYEHPPLDEFGPGSGAATHETNLWGDPGSRGTTLLRMSDLGTISHVLDAHLYQFRALYTGTAEIRINTTDLQDGFWEGMVETMDGDPETDPVPSVLTTKTKTYQSPLHSALRIFNNDLVEVAFNAGNGVTRGESSTHTFASFGEKTFQQRDARVVFQVEAGKNYFVQVESGQRENFTLTFPKVDWRHATGSYELIINSMPQTDFGDDHIDIIGGNFVNTQATPLALDLSETSPTAVLASQPGQILNSPTNPNDTDLFTFAAPGSGVATVSVVTPASGTFARFLAVYDAAGTIRAITAGNAEVISVQFEAQRGERFWIAVEGEGVFPALSDPEANFYEVRVSGIPRIDDNASIPFFNRATEIEKDEYDFTGTTSRLASLEAPGDSDVFSFETIAFDMASITVEGLAVSMVPQVRIYEISVDPVGNPILLLIGHNAGTDANNTANIAFSVTAPERRHLPTNEIYNTYFVVVSGRDPNAHWGDYRLTLNLSVTTDDHPDLGQWDVASPLQPGEAGTWQQSGVIELLGDTDLFQFTAEAQGLATITITSPADSLLLPRVTVYDQNFNPVVNRAGQVVVTGPDEPVSSAVFSFTALRDQTYFIVVEGAPSAGNTHKTEMTGHYTVNLDALIADDHANEHEWDRATEITISRFTGKGLETGELELPLDSDLFFFTTLVEGDMPVIITVPNQAFRAFLRLFDGDRNEIGVAARDGGAGDETGQRNGILKRTLTNLQPGEVYYILVSSDQTEPIESRTGAYTVFLDGPQPPRGEDDHANFGEWNEATIIQLNVLTGAGSAGGIIDYLGDNDLFVFTSLAGSLERPRPAQVWVTTPAGSILDLKVTVFDPAQQMIVADSQGAPGVNAAVDFDITATGQRYWILVEHLDEELGNYTVHVETTPAILNLYYPEGYTSHTVREYVSLVNPNDYEVFYTIRLRYEGSQAETVVANNFVIAPRSRGGITISDALRGAAEGVLANTPYAIVIEADGFIGASLSHYDFGSTLGESFTRTTSDTWTFARGNRWPGSINEFLVYYNPNPTPAKVTLTAYKDDGTIVTQTHVVEGHRRGGWNFNQTEALGIGAFGFTITSEPVNELDEHTGIVAALSHYNLDTRSGYSVLGDPEGGSLAGVLPGITNGPSDFTRVTFFNPSETAATVSINGRYTDSNLPNLMTVITVGPRSFLTMNGAQIGMVANQTMGMRWSSNVDLTVLSSTARAGDADATVSGTNAANSWYFGDAFLNRVHAGRLYFEDLFFYNPNPTPLSVTLNFYNRQGEQTSMIVSIGAHDFAKVALHDLEVAMPRVFNNFGIEARADMPFLASMTHYDLVLGGGWGSAGAPLGRLTPVWRI